MSSPLGMDCLQELSGDRLKIALPCLETRENNYKFEKENASFCPVLNVGLLHTFQVLHLIPVFLEITLQWHIKLALCAGFQRTAYRHEGKREAETLFVGCKLTFS